MRTFAASLGELSALGSPVDLSVADSEDEKEEVEISRSAEFTTLGLWNYQAD
jgi:hypothetical protein